MYQIPWQCHLSHHFILELGMLLPTLMAILFSPFLGFIRTVCTICTLFYYHNEWKSFYMHIVCKAFILSITIQYVYLHTCDMLLDKMIFIFNFWKNELHMAHLEKCFVYNCWLPNCQWLQNPHTVAQNDHLFERESTPSHTNANFTYVYEVITCCAFNYIISLKMVNKIIVHKMVMV